MWSGLGLQPPRPEPAPGGASLVAEPRRAACPPSDAALRALPGVGAYTARAVRSFAFGHDVAAVDTNALRVLARASPARRSRCPRPRPWPTASSRRAGRGTSTRPCSISAPRSARRPAPLRQLPAAPAVPRGDRDGQPTSRPVAGRPDGPAQSPFAGSDRQGRGRLVARAAPRRRDRRCGGRRLRLARRRGPGRADRGRPGGRGIRPLDGRRPPRRVLELR